MINLVHEGRTMINCHYKIFSLPCQPMMCLFSVTLGSSSKNSYSWCVIVFEVQSLCNVFSYILYLITFTLPSWKSYTYDFSIVVIPHPTPWTSSVKSFGEDPRNTFLLHTIVSIIHVGNNIGNMDPCWRRWKESWNHVVVCIWHKHPHSTSVLVLGQSSTSLGDEGYPSWVPISMLVL